MIDVTLWIPSARWTVHCHFAVSCYHTDEILAEMSGLNCPESLLDEAEAFMDSCLLDTGLTYSNRVYRESVMVVSLTSTAAEFMNSLAHEISHVVYDIAVANDDYEKEGLAYLTGEIHETIYPYVRHLLCDHCREQDLGVS